MRVMAVSVWFSEELPELGRWSCATPLDKSLRRLRKVNLKQIEQAALTLKHGQETELSTVLEQAEDWVRRLHSLSEEVRIHRWNLFNISKTILTVLDLFLLSAVSFPFLFPFVFLFVSASFVILALCLQKVRFHREQGTQCICFSSCN